MVRSPTPPRHHELPRFYLSGFCDPQQSQLWVFRKGAAFHPGKKRSHNPRQTGIVSIALRPDGYVAYGDDGTPHYDYERKLQQLEERAVPALRCIHGLKAMDGSAKVALADYLWLMFRRVSQHDDDILPLLREKIRSLALDDEARKLAFSGQFNAAQNVLRVQQLLQSHEGRTELLRQYMFRPYEDVRALVLSRPWLMHVAAPGMFFVSSDAPVVYDRARGLGSASLYFPLSQRVLLEVCPNTQGDLEYVDLSVQQTRERNQHTIRSGAREVYSPRPEEWIHHELTSLTLPRDDGLIPIV
jgi:hypothetical protein